MNPPTRPTRRHAGAALPVRALAAALAWPARAGGAR
jgi:hypothetical protein